MGRRRYPHYGRRIGRDAERVSEKGAPIGGIPEIFFRSWGAAIGNLDIPERERVAAWSSREAAPGGLRRYGLLNAEPSTSGVMGECLIGFPPTIRKRGGSLQVGLADLVNFLICSKLRLVKNGYEVFLNKSGDLAIDFAIWQPCEFGSYPFSETSAFRNCAKNDTPL